MRMETSNLIRTEVLVIGAGPGGCTAALKLAQLGVDVVLVDKSRFPRDKVCGDALSGKVMRTLERLDPALASELRKQSELLPSWGVTFFAPSGKSLRVPFSRNTGTGEAPGAILPRLQFDAFLLDAVKRDGRVRVIEGAEAKHFKRTNDGWSVDLVDRALPSAIANCQLILDSSGANSHFARHVAKLPMEPRHHCAGVRAYFNGVRDLDAQGFIELIFLKELLPGYLWIFPLPNRRANVGLGLRSDVVRKRRVDLKALMTKLLAEHPQLKDRFANATMEGVIQGMGLPLASKRWPISGDGYMLIGDAAHLIDPFTGEGISHAMISGMHAAEVAQQALSEPSASPPLEGVGGGRRNTEALRDYDTRVWKRLGKEVAISTRLQHLAHYPWLFNFVVNKAINNPALADTISSMFNDLDMRERLKSPRFYLDLLLGRKPKAIS